MIKEQRKLKADNEKIVVLEAENLILNEKICVQDRELDEQNKWRDQATVDKQRLQELEESAAACKYAVVLVDGDGYNFPDDLIREGLKGGRKAAQHLESETQSYLKRAYGINQLKIIVRIFINLDGLSNMYQGLGIIKDTYDFRHFMIGFVQTQGLFDLIDVGQGKQRADYKMKGT